MRDINYFSFLCFVWAAVGIASRLLMIHLGDRWSKWELEKAYSQKKPKWIYTVGMLSLIIVGFTWYKVVVSQVRYSWIIALLVSLTLIKVFTLIFNYQQFRELAEEILHDRKKLTQLNIGVIIFSIIFILIGIFLY
jgi:dolichol kinase